MTYIIKDNKTGYLYKTKEENVLEQTLDMLSPVFSRLMSFPNDKQKITDYFKLDMEYTSVSRWSYNNIPEFDWKCILFEDSGEFPNITKIRDYTAKYGSVIVYVTRGGNIARKPLFGSVIPSFDSIIGIYRQAYMRGVPNGVGAYLITKDKEIKNMMEFYKSTYRKVS